MAKSNKYWSERTREEWMAAGSPPCEHPRILKDSNDFGNDPGGDLYCDTCGKTFLWSHPRN